MLCEISKEEEDQGKPDSDTLKGLHNNQNWYRKSSQQPFFFPILCEVFKLKEAAQLHAVM